MNIGAIGISNILADIVRHIENELPPIQVIKLQHNLSLLNMVKLIILFFRICKI